LPSVKREFVGKKIKHRALVFGVMFIVLQLQACSDDNPQSGSTPIPSQPGSQSTFKQQITLSGAYADRIDIVGGPWQASGPQEEVSLTFVVSGLSEVKQFQIDVKPEPALAFEIESAIFTVEDPWFVPFANGVDPTAELGTVKMGAAIFGGAAVSGEQKLGTLTIRTSATFGRLVPAKIGVERFSVGPTSEERDDYTGETLNLGVVVNE